MGPDLERIQYPDGDTRTEERRQFWRTVNGGLGFKSWEQASRWLHRAAKECPECRRTYDHKMDCSQRRADDGRE